MAILIVGVIAAILIRGVQEYRLRRELARRVNVINLAEWRARRSKQAR